MARRITSRKRKHLGNRFFGGGNAKNRRGKGNKGGKGNAGAHKHNWLRTIKRGEHKFRKHGFVGTGKRVPAITLEQINRAIFGGKHAVKEGGLHKVLLPGAKVIGGGELAFPVFVVAAGFSDGSRKKIEASGGKAVVEGRNEEAAKPAAQ